MSLIGVKHGEDNGERVSGGVGIRIRSFGRRCRTACNTVRGIYSGLGAARVARAGGVFLAATLAVLLAFVPTMAYSEEVDPYQGDGGGHSIGDEGDTVGETVTDVVNDFANWATDRFDDLFDSGGFFDYINSHTSDGGGGGHDIDTGADGGGGGHSIGGDDNPSSGTTQANTYTLPIWASKSSDQRENWNGSKVYEIDGKQYYNFTPSEQYGIAEPVTLTLDDELQQYVSEFVASGGTTIIQGLGTDGATSYKFIIYHFDEGVTIEPHTVVVYKYGVAEDMYGYYYYSSDVQRNMQYIIFRATRGEGDTHFVVDAGQTYQRGTSTIKGGSSYKETPTNFATTVGRNEPSGGGDDNPSGGGDDNPSGGGDDNPSGGGGVTWHTYDSDEYTEINNIVNIIDIDGGSTVDLTPVTFRQNLQLLLTRHIGEDLRNFCKVIDTDLGRIYAAIMYVAQQQVNGNKTLSDILKKLNEWPDNSASNDPVTVDLSTIESKLDTIISKMGRSDGGDTVINNDSDKSLGEQIGEKMNEVKERFPFSIPWDVMYILGLVRAEPVAPQFDVPVIGSDEEMHIDLSQWEPVAVVTRNGTLVLFGLGLALRSRTLIRTWGGTSD